MKILLKATALTSALIATQAFALNVPGPLVDPAWVNQHKGEIKVLEIGKLAHIPGAEPINYKKVRVDGTSEKVKGKGLVPSINYWEKLVQSWGINKGDAIVIAYPGKDAKDATKATRVYWQFKYFGENNVALMDGGVYAYAKAKLPLEKKGHGDLKKKGNWVSTHLNGAILATTDDVKLTVEGKSDYQLIDARPASLYQGTWNKSYVKGKGHIATAKNFPFDLITTVKPAKFLSKEEYLRVGKNLGIDLMKPTISYCNSGHFASGVWFLQSEILGNKKAKLYDGSANIWTAHGLPLVK
jgi:thiosulfate/3-mercaptopyruvate sulfurtransferase